MSATIRVGQRYEVSGTVAVQPLIGQQQILHPGVVSVEVTAKGLRVTLPDQARYLDLMPGEIARLEYAGKLHAL
ncbi:hypothetical protein [Acidisphaera sp. L21]|jgi:hypothetical protein|uniref:hypothetical protein n=1 Tax=Acidisphaera sp. L21 TaxID=1641851 RepID=UPI00131B986E|nr:hypothetical protein [Acidisphaera sp. L21]